MDVIKTIAPGQKGSIRYLQEWGEKLVNVRYRRSVETNEIVTTIEVVMDRRPIAPPGSQIKGYLAARAQEPVAVMIGYQEVDLRQKVKQACARWSKQPSLWIMKRKTAVQLGLVDRVVEGAAEKCSDVDHSFL